MNRWGMLFAAAQRQGGAISLATAAEVGIPARTLRQRAEAEGWRRLARGVWVPPGVTDSPDLRARTHVRQLGEGAALSHWSAAHLHGLTATPPRNTQVIVPFDRRPDGPPDTVVRRSRTLTDEDVVEVDGLPVTSVPRTLRDLAHQRTWGQLYDLVTEAEQRELVDLSTLVATMHRLHHGPGSGRFRAVVGQRQSDRSDSALERDTRQLGVEAGFAPSVGPFPIRVAGGRRLWLDVAFPEAWFAIECDGFGFHRSRHAFERDRDRWRLAQHAGWRLTWVTRRRLRDDPHGLVEEIAEAHRTADPARPPALPAG